MTGIERLRKLADDYVMCSWSESGRDRGRVLRDIADQIEREITPQERRDEPADGNADDVSMSAYDLLPQEEREAIAWVREHGGLGAVKEEWKLRSNLKRMCEKERAKVERQQRHIEFVQGKCRERQERIEELNKLNRSYVYALNGVCEHLGLTDGTGLPDMPEVIWAELDRRLMPEGCEWPRFEDGEPVRIGDAIIDELGHAHEVTSVEVFDDAAALHWSPSEPEEFVWLIHGVRARRPKPKDSWERLEEDARNIRTAMLDSDKLPFEVIDERALDLVRRAKALAERDAK